MLDVTVHLLADGLRVPVGTVGSGLKWIVRKDHRVIEEKRTIPVARHEFEGELVDQGGAIFTTLVVEFLAVALETGIRVTRRPAGVLPKKRIVESEVLRQSLVVAELPFS